MIRLNTNFNPDYGKPQRREIPPEKILEILKDLLEGFDAVIEEVLRSLTEEGKLTKEGVKNNLNLLIQVLEEKDSAYKKANQPENAEQVSRKIEELKRLSLELNASSEKKVSKDFLDRIKKLLQ